ncbi:hypothetical protein NKH61_31590 [Mesorhizobium sp. M1005]|uniref:YncE family protein n=3 Tax=Mesorhizobium TaxID=68287 RepID=UPI00333546DB
MNGTFLSIALHLLSRIVATALMAAANLPVATFDAAGQGTEPPLRLEARIPLGDVRGRIDHMAIDLKRRRLFVAELGNNSMAVVDLTHRTVLRTIKGLREPQGVAYLQGTDTLYVANAGDGSVRLFRGADYAAIGKVDLGEDADNVRVDSATNRVFVGYGSGALAVINPTTNRKTGDVPLKAHPESFQLDARTSHAFVNLPDIHSIAVVDRTSLAQIATWPTAGLAGNFPMALDDPHQHVLIAFRHPAWLGIFSMGDGSLVATAKICGDADDVFVDSKRQRAYISCGDGFIDVMDTWDPPYRRIAHIPTVSGARTSLFVPALDLLLLAVRASGEQLPAIWAFRPTP